jgi:predicted GNAT family N-acyltransferase
MNNQDYRCTIIEYGTPEYDESIALRYKILRKPLEMEYEPADLCREYDQWHIGIYNLGYQLVGCLVLQATDNDSIKMRQVAVDERFQNRGIGATMVAFSEKVASEMKYKIMYCHARSTAVPFYERLGYRIIGPEFSEVGIPHRKMEKELS